MLHFKMIFVFEGNCITSDCMHKFLQTKVWIIWTSQNTFQNIFHQLCRFLHHITWESIYCNEDRIDCKNFVFLELYRWLEIFQYIGNLWIPKYGHGHHQNDIVLEGLKSCVIQGILCHRVICLFEARNGSAIHLKSSWFDGNIFLTSANWNNLIQTVSKMKNFYWIMYHFQRKEKFMIAAISFHSIQH